MSSRFKDFSHNEFEYSGPEIISMGPVSVSIIPWKSSLSYHELRQRNEDSVSQYSVIDNSNLPSISWGIEHNGVAAGEVIVWSIDIRNKICKLSYWVDKDHRRKGVASAAVALVCDQIFESFDINEIEAPVAETNEISKEFIKSMLFTMVGYEVLSDKSGSSSKHEVYLLLDPSNEERLLLLSDHVMEKYEHLR